MVASATTIHTSVLVVLHARSQCPECLSHPPSSLEASTPHTKTQSKHSPAHPQCRGRLAPHPRTRLWSTACTWPVSTKYASAPSRREAFA